MGEYEAQLAQASGRMNVGILRLHNVYGPGVSFDPSYSQVIPSLICKAIQFPTEPFVVWGTGNQYRDFVYVDDVVNGLILMLPRGMNKGTIQIGSEQATTMRDLALQIIEISGKKIDVSFDTNRPEGDRGRIANCGRARDILGWSSTIDLRNGLEKTYRWIEAQMSKRS
jgi:GDP-D-mannose 3',5'-epimerase